MKKMLYGKSIDTLSEKEVVLSKIDTTMDMMFSQLVVCNNPIKMVILMGITAELTNKRRELSVELCGISNWGYSPEEEIKHIEDTEYSFGKFLHDNENNKKMDEVESLISEISLN